MIQLILAILIAYCIGSISSAIVVCKLMGLADPRTEGSHNPGATNVLRIGGKKAAVITLMGDLLKGFVPVLAAKLYGFDTLSLSLITFAAFIGHLYPLFFKFQGGKGVATALGCLLALAWPLALAAALTWLVVAILFRYSSLAAIVTAVMTPIYAWLLTNWDYTLMAIAMSLFLIFRHKKNIYNLYHKKEKKIFKRAASEEKH